MNALHDDTKLVPRSEVMSFAMEMEQQLRKNDHKGGWGDCNMQFLIRRAEEELKELKIAIYTNVSLASVQSEAADVANFMLMVADNYEQDLNGYDDSEEKNT